MLPNLVILCSVLSLLCLLTLHFVSPEFKPSWRMISEYALGKYKWLITAFFYLWGIASIILSTLLWSEVSSTWGKNRSNFGFDFRYWCIYGWFI